MLIDKMNTDGGIAMYPDRCVLDAAHGESLLRGWLSGGHADFMRDPSQELLTPRSFSDRSYAIGLSTKRCRRYLCERFK